MVRFFYRNIVKGKKIHILVFVSFICIFKLNMYLRGLTFPIEISFSSLTTKKKVLSDHLRQINLHGIGSEDVQTNIVSSE